MVWGWLNPFAAGEGTSLGTIYIPQVSSGGSWPWGRPQVPPSTAHRPSLPCSLPLRAGDPLGTNPALSRAQAHVCRCTLVTSIYYYMFLQALSFPGSAKNVSFSFCTTAPRWLGSPEGFHGLWSRKTKGLGFLQARDVFCFDFLCVLSLQGELLQLT